MSRDDVETTCLNVLHRYSALLRFCRIESDAISEPYGLEKLIGHWPTWRYQLSLRGLPVPRDPKHRPSSNRPRETEKSLNRRKAYFCPTSRSYFSRKRFNFPSGQGQKALNLVQKTRFETQSCQVIYSQFGLAIHQNDHQARRKFVEWAQNEIAVVSDFHKRVLFSDEAHFWLNGYVNKQNCRIWSEANPQSLVYADKPQTLDHLEDNIHRVIADRRPQMLEKVIENWTSRLDYIRASRGSHMPGIIFKM
ncbi:hypothetical protein TNCV_4597941 [Trichonephila clavipes]|nr:hypothetical protein TNCV_4597941 [Trichonephila clavipes]